MAKEKIPEDVVKDTCPGYLEEECINCKHTSEPVALKLKIGRKSGFITEEFLKKLISEDGGDITGNFVPGCKFRQRIIRKDHNGVTKYHLMQYRGSERLSCKQMF